jgi:hypothetical protein
MTAEQEAALRDCCERFHVPFDPANYHQRFDLPSTWVAGWVGPIYVGCSPTGEISS